MTSPDLNSPEADPWNPDTEEVSAQSSTSENFFGKRSNVSYPTDVEKAKHPAFLLSFSDKEIIETIQFRMPQLHLAAEAVGEASLLP